MPAKAKSIRSKVVGHTLDEIIAAMPPESQVRIAERSAVLHAEVEGLKALRKLAERSQEQIHRAWGSSSLLSSRSNARLTFTYPRCVGS